jgi:hypothetical protein
LKGNLELHPMWICYEGFSGNGRFIILFGVKVKTTNKGMQGGPTKIITKCQLPQ